jgi:hypothetical protein
MDSSLRLAAHKLADSADTHSDAGGTLRDFKSTALESDLSPTASLRSQASYLCLYSFALNVGSCAAQARARAMAFCSLNVICRTGTVDLDAFSR